MQERPRTGVPMRTVIRSAAVFASLWFLANYVYRFACLHPHCCATHRSLSLNMTTVSSNTIISCTSGFFTLILSAIFPASDTDRFTPLKLAIVLVTIGGVALVRYDYV